MTFVSVKCESLEISCFQIWVLLNLRFCPSCGFWVFGFHFQSSNGLSCLLWRLEEMGIVRALMWSIAS